MSSKNSVGARDAEFLRHLSYRNIFLDCDASVNLGRRVTNILDERRSPETDEVVEELKKKARDSRNKDEFDIHTGLGLSLIPEIPRSLVKIGSRVWSNSVPVPFIQSILSSVLPLAKPKPDLCIGYVAEAFMPDQLEAIRSLRDSETDKSYALPCEDLYFPFLVIETKSQAKGGTLIHATNQASNAGAIIGHGLVELARRSLGLESIDYDEPQMFSLVLDHKVAQLNVHWLDPHGERFRFCMTELVPIYPLQESDKIRALRRSIRNIYDWGVKRLSTIRSLVDAYAESFQKQTEAVETLVTDYKISPPPGSGEEAESGQGKVTRELRSGASRGRTGGSRGQKVGGRRGRSRRQA